jgi:hypothetical protein
MAAVCRMFPWRLLHVSMAAFVCEVGCRRGHEQSQQPLCFFVLTLLCVGGGVGGQEPCPGMNTYAGCTSDSKLACVAGVVLFPGSPSAACTSVW